MSKNIFDPFGVFGEWKGQDPDDEYETWETRTLKEILEDQSQQIDNVITDAAWAGILAERDRCLSIIRQNLSSEDADRVIHLIQGTESE